MYVIVCTRADVAMHVGALAKFLKSPTIVHWQHALQVLKYLNTTREYGLVYGPEGDHELYADADYASDPEGRKSRSGGCSMLGGGAIAWWSKVQPTVALSTSESELMSITSCTKEALWEAKLFRDLDIPLRPNGSKINEDNQGALKIIKNPISSDQIKHIAVRHFFVRERVARGEIEMVYCGTESNVADILT